MEWAVPLEAFQRGSTAAENGAFTGLRHGTMRVLLYAPRGSDPQTPHKQDEIYIIRAGHGAFVKSGERRPFEPGDVLFVAAGEDHRFDAFSDDFEAWVVFWGPEGGEAQ